MRESSQQCLDSEGGRLNVLANWVVRVCGSAIFLFLIWYSMRYTQYINPGGSETPVNVHDSISRNVLLLLLVAAVFVWLMHLEKKLAPRLRRLIMRGSMILAMLWIGLWSLWWITAAERMPQGDQAFVYGGASYFLEGNYAFLSPGGYCDVYPHQLALIAMTEILFLFAGAYNYFAFQCVCVILAVAIVYIGYQIVGEITDAMSVTVIYSLTILGCFPLIFYTGWVYGDIPSIFFALLTAWMLLCYSRKGHWGYLAATVASLTFGVLVRKNSMILVVAFCIIAFVRTVQNRDRRILLAALLSVLLPTLVYSGVYKMYELRSDTVHSKGLPTISWVAMGLQETNGSYGWYNNYPKEVYYAVGCDREVAELVYRQEIKNRIKLFFTTPSYGWTFFREKLLSQWNEPLYQSMYFTTKYKDENRPEEESFVAKLSSRYFTKVLWICDRLQFILYVGMLMYFLYAVKPDSNLLQHLLAVTVIGGFLFSIFWEAKARYVLPYYITMFPLSAVGYWQMINRIRMLFGQGRSNTKDNITDFSRAA